MSHMFPANEWSAAAHSPLLTVVIPTYNEARRLEPTLQRITSYLQAQPYDWEIILVDDGSKDGTIRLEHQWMENWPQIRVLSNGRNRGKGYSVRRGVLAARGEYVLFSDADLSTPIEEVERVLPSLQAGYDVVIGSRALPDSRIISPQPLPRRLMGKVFRVLTGRLAQHGVKDTQCGFKGFHTIAARHIFSQLHTQRFAFDVEVLLLARALGYAIQEIGVTWANNRESTVSAGDPLRMLRDIWRMRQHVDQRLESARDVIPGPGVPAIALVKLVQIGGREHLPVGQLVDPERRAGDSLLLEPRPGEAQVALVAVTAEEAADAAHRYATQATASAARLGRGSAIAEVIQMLPLATSSVDLRTVESRDVPAGGATLLDKLEIATEREAAQQQHLAIRERVWARRRVIVRSLIIANLAGLIWWLLWLFNFGNAQNPVLYTALVIAESFSIVQVLGYWYTVWHDQKPERKRAHVAGTVDAFIPTYNEPVHVVERTVRAAVAMTYPHQTFVLDDGNRSEIGEMARRLGAEWITRADNKGAKAGNINHALERTAGTFFAVFDADHAPHPQFLDQMVPYMEDPRMAFVQAPQYYCNREQTYVAGGAMDQQEIFFGPICRGKGGLGAVFCCGTNMVMRREAVAEVGGFQEGSVVEDAVTSLELHTRGWHSQYVDEHLADGLAPEDLGAYLSQQRRWARGNLEMLLQRNVMARHMPFRIRFQYVWSALYYLTGLSSLVYFSLPVLFLLFGIQTVSARSTDFIAHFLPYIFVTIFILARSTEGQLRFRAIQFSYGLFPVFLGALWSVVSGGRARFIVTPKVRKEGSFYHLIVPQIAVITVSALAIAVGFAHYAGVSTITNSSWALFNIIMLWAMLRAAAPRQGQQADLMARNNVESEVAA
jgi:cellulose synthase (UDP-forming)